MQVQLALPLGLTETAEEIFWRVYCQTRVKSRRALSVTAAAVTWRPYTNSIGIVRARNGKLEVSLSQALQQAPPDVLEALAEILVSKLFRRRVSPEYRTRYRNWLHHEDTRSHLDSVRRTRGRKRVDTSGGVHYDLAAVFANVNRDYFDGAVSQPALAWSTRASRTHLGHWDPVHSTIVLSRALDSAAVPAVVVEYVMYHEMLHILHPVEHTEGRRKIHTRAFRAAEKQFAGFQPARQFLKSFCQRGLSF